MKKVKPTIGIVAGVLLILSAGAHSFMGGVEIRKQLQALNTPADLLENLMIGWHFGGVAMVVFGLIAIYNSVKPGRVKFAAWAVGLSYAGFGVFSLATTGNPFFWIFIIPGALLTFALL